MGAKPKRQAIHAFVSEEVFEAWHSYSEIHGVTVSGLIEAQGLAICEALENGSEGGYRPDWIQEARRVDARRRRRNS